MNAITEARHLRQPPYAEAAEQSVLGGLMIDPTADAGSLRAAHFFDMRHRWIFQAVTTLLGANKPADVVSVFEALRNAGRAEDCGGLAYLQALSMCVESARSVGRHAAIVRDKATLRELIAATDTIAAQAFTAPSAAVVADHAAGLFAGIATQQVQSAPRSIAEIAIARLAHYEALERGEVAPGWPTHFPRLDELLTGGLRPGSLYILAARPSVGKSSLALALSETMAEQGLPTLFCSQEMPAPEVADRAVVLAGRVPYGALMAGKLDHDGWGRAADALDKLRSLPLYVDEQAAMTLLDIKAKARSVKGLKVLVIDYLQLCAGTNADDNRNGQIEQLSRGLKAMAKEMGIAVVALSQLNRAVEQRANKRPNLGDLRDSGAIEQDADVVLFLWLHRDFDQAEGRKIIGADVAKNRQGRTGVFAFDFYGTHQRWGESTVDPTHQPTGGSKFE